MALDNVAWSFSNKCYESPDEFNKEFTQYQKDIYDTDEDWNPDEIILDTTEVLIEYEAWITSPDDLLENERLIEDDKGVFEKYPDDSEYQVEIIASLKADNGKNFTALEFMLKAHNQQSNKELGDHVFFEGIDDEPMIIDGLPLYYIACGS